MASVTVWTCPGGAAHTRVDPSSGEEFGTCDGGQGQWQQVVIAEPFDPSTLNSSELGSAFAAGFVVMGTGLAIAWACRKVVEAIKEGLL